MKPICLMLLPALGLALATMEVKAQTWPSKPLRVIVPFGAGSTTDIVPRIVFEQLSPQLGQSIVVENRGGAGGTIGAATVAKADPDGYTVLVNSSAHAITPSLYPNLNYDPVRDFASVISLGISPHVLVVSPAKGFKTVRDFIAAAKAKPGAFTFSSVGNGSATHMSAERFRAQHRHPGRARSVQGWSRSDVRSDGRTDRFLFRTGGARPAARQGWQAHRARGEWCQTFGRVTGRADHTGGGHQGRRVCDLVRNVPARQDSAPHRRQTQQRDTEGSPNTEGAGQADFIGRRPDAHDAESLRRIRPKGDHLERSISQSDRCQAGLTTSDVI